MKIMKGNIPVDTIVKINKPPQSKDIDFVDYDGTLLYSYTLDEIQEITELPPLPTQPGLICQEWNWSLEDIKAHNRRLIVGATYITDDGKTRIYINLTEEDRLDVPLFFQQSTSSGVEVDWGDGSPVERFKGGTSVEAIHSYKKSGKYIIALNSTNPFFNVIFGGSNKSNGIFGGYSNMTNRYYYANIITKIHFGSNVIIRDNAFFECRLLSKVTIPNNITSIGSYAFYNCPSLLTVVIPKGIRTINTHLFESCKSLYNVVIPNSVTTIDHYAFNKCNHLLYLIIPNSVTSIGYYMFEECSLLLNMIIPEKITQLCYNMFKGCYSLSSITLPNEIKRINSYVFSSCYAIRKYNFSQYTQVPTLDSTNVFSGITSECKIIVPDELYDEWIAATNWSNYADYIIKVSEV